MPAHLTVAAGAPAGNRLEQGLPPPCRECQAVWLGAGAWTWMVAAPSGPAPCWARPGSWTGQAQGEMETSFLLM